MLKKKKELIDWCVGKLGTPYVYGAKGEILTQGKIDLLAAMYPSTYSKTYIDKSEQFIGKACTDCSGLISWFTGKLRGSTQYRDTAAESVPIGQLSERMTGWALWKPEHIGIYVGNGYCIEAKGINYGTVKTHISSTPWVKALKLCDIDYSEIIIQNGWVQEEKGWKYYENNISVTGWKMIDHVWYYLKPDGYMVSSEWIQDKGYWYYLNANGSLYYGWLFYKDKWCYLNKDSSPEGAMVTGFQKLKYNGELNDYFFNEDGYMITESITAIPDKAGVLKVNIGNK